MSLKLAQSKDAQSAYGLVKDLQALLVKELDKIPPTPPTTRFQPVHWLRAKGIYGGGTRYVATDSTVFNRASVNISQVQYEGDGTKKLNSATAISAIVHPRNPFAPSLHIHVSWTELKSGTGYWRIMADLNPSIPMEEDRDAFEKALAEAAGDLYQEGRDQGQLYFYIPALGRHRGVAHFYLEEFARSDREADRRFALNLGSKVIRCYGGIVTKALQSHTNYSEFDERQQLDYHSLYFLQVLLLDRGTTSGLLVHDDNDLGILGSLPSHVDPKLLESWLPRQPPLQQKLLRSLLQSLAAGPKSLVDDPVKLRLAQAAREFYRQHPDAQDLMAKGKTIPPTVANHQ